MLNFILGRAGAGKTSYIHSLIKSLACSSVHNMTLIVPEQASFCTERKILKLLGADGFESVDVLSFTRLAETVLSQRGHKRLPRIDDGGRAVVMSMALDAVTDKLDIYKNSSKSVSLVDSLLAVSQELKSCAVNLMQLKQTAEAMDSCLLKQKLGEISLILQAYDAMVTQSFEDDRDVLTLLYSELEENKFFENRIVFIDEFSGFTQQEFKIIYRMLRAAKEVYVTLCTDDLYADDSGAFEHIRLTSKILIDTANRAGVSVAKPLLLSQESGGRIREKDDALCALEASIYNPRAAVYEQSAQSITVCSARDTYEECAYVALEAKRLIREKGYRCRDIAVISRSSEQYESSLRSALVKCGVPVFEDKRQPVINQPLILLLRSATDAAANGFSFDTVMRVLKTGLTSITPDEVSQIENYALMWSISSERWVKDWEYHPRGYGNELSSDDISYLEVLNDIRTRAIKPLETLKAALRDTNGEDAANALYSFLQSVDAAQHLKELAISLEETGNKSLALEQQRVWEIAMEMLDLLYMTVGSTPIKPKRLLELFDIIISTRTLGSIPQGLDEIAIGSADRIITDSPRAVFVVGANDGVFPKDPKKRGIFNDNDRQRLTQLGIELHDSGEYRVVSERFLVYKSLCCAIERVYVTYSSCDSDGSVLGASEFVSQITEKFPRCIKRDTALMFARELPEGIRPAFEQMCLVTRSRGEMYATLREWFDSKGDYGDKLRALDTAAGDVSFTISDTEIASKLFGRNMTLSASRVERFYRCPFSYFCEYGLLAKPRLKAEFDPMQQGTQVHFVLETILRKHGKDGLLAMTAQQRRQEVDEILRKYLIEKLGGANKPKRFEYLYARLTKTMCEILERLVLEFSVSKFEPVDFELKIGSDGSIAPYSVRLESGATVNVCGSVDRVDKLEMNGKTYIRVVDYKSGSKKFLLSDVLSGLNMQMLLYLFAIWDNGAKKYGDIVPSGVLYMPARAQIVPTQRDTDNDTIALKKAKALTMSGMVLSDEAVILGMESGAGGVFIPVAKDKSGNLKGSLYTLVQLERLKKRADKNLCNMAQLLSDGDISPMPVSGKNYKDICTYCNYSDVCGHESDSPVRGIEYMADNDCFAILEGQGAAE